MFSLLFVLALVQQSFGFLGPDFYLYRREGNSGKLDSEKLPPDFNKSKPTYLILHGMGGSHDDICNGNLIDAILEKYDANVISPDYQEAGVSYMLLYKQITKQIVEFLKNNNIDPANIIVLGLSLGGQIAGSLNGYGYKPKTIVAMDPAGPNFENMPSAYKLTPSSAGNVQVIHTNSGVLGTVGPDGHLDVYINKGNDFPCCTTDFCKHVGSCYWMAETIRNGPAAAVSCASQLTAKAGMCRGSRVMTGFGVTPTSRKTVALLTRDTCVQGQLKI